MTRRSNPYTRDTISYTAYGMQPFIEVENSKEWDDFISMIFRVDKMGVIYRGYTTWLWDLYYRYDGNLTNYYNSISDKTQRNYLKEKRWITHLKGWGKILEYNGNVMYMMYFVNREDAFKYELASYWAVVLDKDYTKWPGYARLGIGEKVQFLKKY